MQNEETQDVALENNEETVEETPTEVEEEIDWKAEALKQKAINQRLSKKKTITQQPITNQKPVTYGIEDEVLDLRLDGYTKPQVEFIMKNGGKKSLEDKNSLTAIAIRQQKEQEKAEHAASQTVDTSSISEVERKFTKEQLKNMSAKELEAILPRA